MMDHYRIDNFIIVEKKESRKTYKKLVNKNVQNKELNDTKNENK